MPVCWDRHLRRYVEDCTAYCEQPGYTPAGRPVLLTFEDACPPGRDGGRRPARHRLRRLPTLPSISRLPAGRMQKRKAQKEKAARPQGRPNPKKQGGNMMPKAGRRFCLCAARRCFWGQSRPAPPAAAAAPACATCRQGLRAAKQREKPGNPFYGLPGFLHAPGACLRWRGFWPYMLFLAVTFSFLTGCLQKSG